MRRLGQPWKAKRSGTGVEQGRSTQLTHCKGSGGRTTIGPTLMPPTQATAEAVRRQLDKILSGRGFVGNDCQSKFLRFVVEQQLLGKGVELKESLVGIEVFGRTPGFNPRQDSVVRTEAARLPPSVAVLRRRGCRGSDRNRVAEGRLHANVSPA